MVQTRSMDRAQVILSEQAGVPHTNAEASDRQVARDSEVPLNIECNRNSRSRRVTKTVCVPSALPAKCKCGSLKESCAVDGCPSMYCRNSQAIDSKDFKKCDCCNEVYCANHMDFITQCCECDEEFCYYCPPDECCCEYCFEPLCQNCQSGDHQAICVFEQSDSYHPNAPLSETQKAALVELKDQHGQAALEDMFDCYTC